jgi:hypothetical protein
MLYANPLSYSIRLLFFIVLVLFYLVRSFFIQPLTMIMFCIIYLGAIIIFIGYICAISPNFSLQSNFSNIYFILRFIFLIFINFLFKASFFTSMSSLVEFFYSFRGLIVFFSLALLLFVSLLIVTSQYLTPKGPFRSV